MAKKKAAKKTKKKFAKEFPKPVAWVDDSKAMEFALRPGKRKWPEWPKGIAWERPYRLSNGDIYAGQWKDDKPDGYGDCEYLTGAIYSGEWKDGSKVERGEEGQGTQYSLSLRLHFPEI